MELSANKKEMIQIFHDLLFQSLKDCDESLSSKKEKE